MLRIATIIIAIVLSASAAAQWTLPILHTRTLANANFSIPTDFPAGASLLIIGFTNASRDQTSAWSRILAQDGSPSDPITTYQVAVIDDVPVIMRRLVIRGIRSGVPESLHDRFLIVEDKSEDWKALVSYSEPDIAYLALLDKQGNVRWLGTGEPSTTSLQELRVKVAELKGI